MSLRSAWFTDRVPGQPGLHRETQRGQGLGAAQCGRKLQTAQKWCKVLIQPSRLTVSNAVICRLGVVTHLKSCHWVGGGELGLNKFKVDLNSG